ncbi:MAG: GNAT family N-acetyltransferase [Sphingomonas sp.]|nr:GNAT family N-acetyltransferase [Sphingomonas sp.]RZV52680.1 MAG: N-acetyltransferase [Sphingomonadaceae bacterium]
MFAVTKRLLLRPGWSNDAPALARAIADEQIVRNLARAPWPYGLEDAQKHLDTMATADLPVLLITKRDNAEIVGILGFDRIETGEVELGYWIARKHWNRGYATEAGLAALDIIKTLGFAQVVAGHFTDNPASGRVLRKLGFAPTGEKAMRHSCGRGEEAEVMMYALDLGEIADRVAA